MRNKSLKNQLKAQFYRGNIPILCLAVFASLVSGKSSLVGSLKTVSLGGKLAASFVETARGVLVYFVLRSNNTPVWVDWIAPTEWVFQPDGLLTKLADDARKAGASAEQIALIAAAFDACAEVVVSREDAYA